MKIPIWLGMIIGGVTIALVNRSSKPAAGRDTIAVWVSPIWRSGSNYYDRPGWLGYWAIIPNGQVVNATTPPV